MIFFFSEGSGPSALRKSVSTVAAVAALPPTSSDVILEPSSDSSERRSKCDLSRLSRVSQSGRCCGVERPVGRSCLSRVPSAFSRAPNCPPQAVPDRAEQRRAKGEHGEGSDDGGKAVGCTHCANEARVRLARGTREGCVATRWSRGIIGGVGGGRYTRVADDARKW